MFYYDFDKMENFKVNTRVTIEYVESDFIMVCICYTGRHGGLVLILEYSFACNVQGFIEVLEYTYQRFCFSFPLTPDLCYSDSDASVGWVFLSFFMYLEGL